MRKCDFCGCQSSHGTCLGEVGGSECKAAARAFAEYMKVIATSGNNTKNINVNKTYTNKNKGK